MRASDLGGFPGYCGTPLGLRIALYEEVPLEPCRAQETRMKRVLGRNG